MSQQRQNARRKTKRPTVARGEQKQVSVQSEQSSPQSIRPSNDDHAAWLAYWQEQNQTWRTEPEICPERRAELEKRRAFVPDVEKGIYPFKGMKLDRADVEWLLATHESVPIKWSDQKEREDEGLDVRGANLQQADLHQLPLTCLRGGLTFDEWWGATEEQRSSAAVLMGGANLSRAQLEGADLSGARLEGVVLSGAQLKGADLSGARLEGANLNGSQLEGANLSRAQLEGANLSRAQLEGANLSKARLEGANLSRAQLGRADLSEAQLEGANLSGARLEGVVLSGAQLKGADLSGARLEQAYLNGAQLEGADLSGAQLGRADLSRAQLEGVVLSGAQLDGANLSRAQLKGADLSGARLKGADLSRAQLEGARLNSVILGNQQGVGPQLADVQWGNANLTVVDWSQVAMLGDEWEVRQRCLRNGKKSEKNERLNDYQAAVRANRQLAVTLQAQGLNEDAARFAYRANVLQRKVYWYQTFLRSEREGKKKQLYVLVWKRLATTWGRVRKFGSYVFSLFLDMLAGYGYRPGRTLGWYVLVVLSFAGVYFSLEHVTKLHLSFIGAIIFSITAFHGRGFFPGGLGYDDLGTILAATEAVVGLLIELSFIATFTQRYFGK